MSTAVTWVATVAITSYSFLLLAAAGLGVSISWVGYGELISLMSFERERSASKVFIVLYCESGAYLYLCCLSGTQ
jgi:hypothetical protein